VNKKLQVFSFAVSRRSIFGRTVFWSLSAHPVVYVRSFRLNEYNIISVNLWPDAAPLVLPIKAADAVWFGRIGRLWPWTRRQYSLPELGWTNVWPQVGARARYHVFRWFRRLWTTSKQEPDQLIERRVHIVPW